MKRRRFGLIGIPAGLAACLAMLAGAPGASALTITVSTTNDELGGNPAACSLREAISSANSNSPIGGCTAGSGADVVKLPAGEYRIVQPGSNEDANSTGDFDITGSESVTVEPAGSDDKVTVDGNGLDRVFDQPGTAPLQVNNLTVSGGQTPVVNDGGGIRNGGGALTVNGSTITDNQATVSGGGIAVYANRHDRQQHDFRQPVRRRRRRYIRGRRRVADRQELDDHRQRSRLRRQRQRRRRRLQRGDGDLGQLLQRDQRRKPRRFVAAGEPVAGLLQHQCLLLPPIHPEHPGDGGRELPGRVRPSGQPGRRRPDGRAAGRQRRHHQHPRAAGRQPRDRGRRHLGQRRLPAGRPERQRPSGRQLRHRRGPVHRERDPRSPSRGRLGGPEDRQGQAE
ncbi:MAG: CSLREA domain-containing protein, partial [Solirubrobacterales bacterium]|nr:CSLREA domain-containing protein [Solirubrobacterales bacterium]